MIIYDDTQWHVITYDNIAGVWVNPMPPPSPTHAATPVPFVWWDGRRGKKSQREKTCGLRQNKCEWSWGTEKASVLFSSSWNVSMVSIGLVTNLNHSLTQAERRVNPVPASPAQPAVLQIIKHSSIWSSGNLLMVFLCLSTSWFQ